MNNNQDKKEMLLPPAELLERYDNISKGLSKELVSLILKEQEHRHKIQNQYLMHFRLGQIFGASFLIYIIYKIFELIKNNQNNVAYTLIGVFGFLIVLILYQYRKDKLHIIDRNNREISKKYNSHYKKSYQSNKR